MKLPEPRLQNLRLKGTKAYVLGGSRDLVSKSISTLIGVIVIDKYSHLTL